MSEQGVFTISLDTELAWGSFDRDPEVHRTAYRRTPMIVDRMCGLFEEYRVSATWAIVAHLLEDCAGEHADGSASWTEWLRDAPCRRGLDRKLWYAPEMVERITDCAVAQEIGLHGYSHLLFDQHDRDTVRTELAAAVKTAKSAGIDPTTFIYPRNQIAYTDLLADFGFTAYRETDARWYERVNWAAVRKGLRYFDEFAALTPPTVTPIERDSIVQIPGSQIFRPAHGAWGVTPGQTTLRRARKGLDRAAATGEMFHLWFHPFNLGRDPDRLLTTLELILKYAAQLRRADKIEIKSMADVATATRTQNGMANRSAPGPADGDTEGEIQ